MKSDAIFYFEHRMNHYPVIQISLRFTLAVLAFFLFFRPVAAPAKIFTVASYNVENLFDLKLDSTEYPEYIPDGPFGWNRDMLDIKCRNIARVIRDLDAEILVLQEIESRQALQYLQAQLARMNIHYAHAAIADTKPTAVKCAMLSKFPMASISEIHVPGPGARSILKAVLDIDGRHLIVFVNHWKSKSGPESQRLPYAKALAEELAGLDAAADFILIGDFNSDYNEFETFREIERFNDTDGITGINHVLNTVKNGNLVDESLLVRQSGNRYLYNLWLELPEYRRWSVNFFGRKNSPDAIIVSVGLYDDQGIAYIDNSFDRFDPEYLFKDGALYRWQRAESGRGKHLGQGYSDHLPVYARFTTRPFEWAGSLNRKTSPETITISGLYNDSSGRDVFRILRAAVIYKHGDSAVIKQKGGRSIYVHRAAKSLKMGTVYDMTVTALKRFRGNLQIVAVEDPSPVGTIPEGDKSSSFYLFGSKLNLSDPSLANEVIGNMTGTYRSGWFHYGVKRKIRLYFADEALKPEAEGRMIIQNARIGYFDGPEIIIEKNGQLREARQSVEFLQREFISEDRFGFDPGGRMWGGSLSAFPF